MSERRLTRTTRSGSLPPGQAARDRAVRRLVQTEFPPAPPRVIPRSLSETLKEAIRGSGLSTYEIAKRARVSQIVISRFLSGERDIRMATADRLASVLGLRLIGS